MTDGQPGTSGTDSDRTRRRAQRSIAPSSETARFGGETVIGPTDDPGSPAPPTTVLMPVGQYAGLLAAPQAEGELGRLGDYAVLRELGRGGMGLVFEAEDVRLRRRVALKVMLPEVAQDAQAKERFLREARAAAAVDHENVVPIFQVGEDRGVPFLVMRLLPGQTLACLLAGGGPLPVARLVELGRQTALGLAAAHARGLVHRDVKPANLWVEPGGKVRVLDFGLARASEATGELTRTGNVVGTPEYLAPEQLRGEELDGRADLFSLGAVLYRAATGTSPFRRETLYSTLRAVEADSPADPRTLRPDLPAPVAELILALLAKDRSKRPASAAAVAARLEEIGWSVAPQVTRSAPSHPSPVASVFPEGGAGPGSAPQPSRRAATAGAQGPPRRNRWLLLGAGGAAFGLGLLGVIFSITLEVDGATLKIQGLDPDMSVRVSEGGTLVEVIDRKSGGKAVLDPGTYELTLTGGGSHDLEARLTEETVTLSRGRETVVTIEKLHEADNGSAADEPRGPTRPLIAAAAPPVGPLGWKPGAGGDLLPGFIARPADLPGIKRWNVETVAPRADVRYVEWNPVRPLAVAVQINGLRVYETAGWKPVAIRKADLGDTAAAWSPDGTSLAYRDDDRVLLLDAETWDVRELLPSRKQGLPVMSLAWNPAGDMLAIGFVGGGVVLRRKDGGIGPALGAPAGLPAEEVAAAAVVVGWSSDGTRVAAGLWKRDEADEVLVWPAGGGDPEVRLPSGEMPDPGPSKKQGLAWDPAGPRLAYVGPEKTVRVWSPGSEPKALSGEVPDACSLAWRRDGSRLAAVGSTGALRAWDAAGTQVGEAQEPLRYALVTWSPDGERIATVDTESDRQVRLWAPDAKPLPELSPHGYVRHVAWGRDGRLLIGDTTDLIGLALLSPTGAVTPAVPRPAGRVLSVRWDAASGRLATCGIDGTARVWSDAGRLQFAATVDSWLWDVGWTADGHLFGTADGMIWTWNAAGRVSVPRGVRPEALHGIVGDFSTAWDPLGEFLVGYLDYSKASSVLRPLAGGRDRLLDVPGEGNCRSAWWRPDGAMFAVTSRDGKIVRLFDRGGKAAATWDAPAPLVELYWSPDGRRLAGASPEADSVFLWSPDGTLTGTIKVPALSGLPHSMAWSPESDRLLTADYGGAARVWHLDGSAGPVMRGTTDGDMTAVAWGAGDRVASADFVGRLVVWDLGTASPAWTAALLGDGGAVSFTAAGEVIHGPPGVMDKELVYLVESEDGRQRVLSPAEFRTLVGQGGDRGPAVSPESSEREVAR